MFSIHLGQRLPKRPNIALQRTARLRLSWQFNAPRSPSPAIAGLIRKIGEIISRTESAADPSEQDDIGRSIAQRVRKNDTQLVNKIGRDRVQPIRSVENDVANAIFSLGQDVPSHHFAFRTIRLLFPSVRGRLPAGTNTT